MRTPLIAAVLIMSTLPLEAAQRVETELVPVEVEQVAEFSHPWGMTMLPSGDILVTERDGRLWRVSPGGIKTEIAGVPAVAAIGQGGLLDIAADPEFVENARVFFTYSQPGPGGAGTALASATLDGDRLEQLRILFSMNRKTGQGRHFGSRIVFAPDDTLFVTTGDRGDGGRAQDPFDHAGSVMSACSATVRCLRAIPSLTVGPVRRKSGRSVTAIYRAPPLIPIAANCSPSNTARAAATRLMRPSRVATMAGR